MEINGVIRSYRERTNPSGDSFFEIIIHDKMQAHKVYLDAHLGKGFFDHYDFDSPIKCICSESDKGIYMKSWSIPRKPYVPTVTNAALEQSAEYYKQEYIAGIRHEFIKREFGKGFIVNRIPSAYAHELPNGIRIGSSIIPNHISKIDYCMDVLTPALVTLELEKMLETPAGKVKWSKLIDDGKEFSAKYKTKLNEIYQLALGESNQPEYTKIA